MAAYLMLFSFTEKGMTNIKESPARVEAAKQVVRQMGGEVRAFYALQGSRYDTMFIIDAPEQEMVEEMALAISARGYVRAQTHRLYDEAGFQKLISSLK